MTTATVTAVQSNGDFTNEHGQFFSFEYTFSDGLTMYANHKKPDGNFKVGEQIEYEVTKDNEYGKKGRVVKPNSTPYKNNGSTSVPNKSSVDWARKDRIIARQSSLKVALDYLHQKGFQNQDQVSQLQELTNVAEFITDYVLSDSDGTPVCSHQNAEKVAQNVNKAVNTPSYDSSSEADLQRQQATAHLENDLPF